MARKRRAYAGATGSDYLGGSLRLRLTAFLALCVFFSLLPSVALAHTENSEGYSKIIQDSGSLRYKLYLDYFELGRVVGT